MTVPEDGPQVFPLLLGMEWFGDKPGGANRYFADLLLALREDEGPEAVAIALGPAQHAPSEVFAVASHAAPILDRLTAFGRKAEQLAATADVVDGHFALYTAAALAFRRVRARPLVVHFQGPWAAESRLQAQGRAVVATKRRVERFVYRRADAVVVLSEAFRRLVVAEYGVVPWRVRVIPPAVDLQRFAPGDRGAARTALGLPTGAFVVATARRLVPRMGLDTLVEAFEPIAASAPSVLAIAGEGPARTEIERSVHGRGLEQHVRLLGRVGDEDLVALYRAADVVVVPSTELEGYGLVVLEALACGTPVVATSVGGLPDALAGLDATLLVPPDDPQALTARLATLREHADGPSPSRCRDHAAAFDLPSLARRHRQLYRTVVRPEPRCRVVYLTHTAQPSGAELALVRLVTALGDAVRPHVILGEEGPLCDELVRAGISHEVLALGPSGRLRREHVGRLDHSQARAALGTAGYVVRLARRLRALRPDLVHCNSLKSAVYGAPAARIAGVPTLWHLHDRISADYLPPAAVRLVRGLARVAPDGVLANSTASLDTLPLSRGPRWVVGNAVQIAGDPASPTPAQPFTVGVVGRLAPWKGQAVALEAFAKAFPAGDERCRIIGASLFGEIGYERQLRELADTLGIDDRVELRGHCADIWSEYRELDVVVHSSVVPEPFGQVVVEAQAAGRPVIAAAAGGVLDLVDDGETGLLYPPGDVGALAERLRLLAHDTGTRHRLASGGPVAARRFSPPRIARQVLAVYSDLLGDRDGL